MRNNYPLPLKFNFMLRLFRLSGLGIWLAAFCFCSSLWGSFTTHWLGWLIALGFATFSLVCFIIFFFMIKPLLK